MGVGSFSNLSFRKRSAIICVYNYVYTAAQGKKQDQDSDIGCRPYSNLFTERNTAEALVACRIRNSTLGQRYIACER